ncbi:MAG: amidohydrolase family protein [Solirubrobacterales bacterium]
MSHHGRTFVEGLEFVLTVDSGNRMIRDATLVVEGDRLLAVGPASEVARSLEPEPTDVTVDGSRLGATPGFIDTHVHLSETLSRASFPDCLGTRAWVFHWVMPFYGQLTEEDERLSVILGAIEMLRSGTTCFLDMGALRDPRATVPALSELGIRGVTGRHAADVRPAAVPRGWSDEMMDRHFFPDAATALEELEACVRELNGAGDGRIGCWVNIQGKEPCSAELHVGARELAERLGVGTTYHIASTVEEARSTERRYGKTPVARIAALEGLGSNLVLAHATAVAEDEIALLAQYDTKVAFCPGTALKLAKGATRVGKYPEMMDAEVTVGLGTDGVSASGNLDLKRQMYLAAGLFKDSRRDPASVDAQGALRMATIEGARALGMDNEVGSLERGKKADFVLFDLDHPEWVTYQDPLQALVWSATSASIHQTWVGGRALFREGIVTTAPDELELRQEARERAIRLVQAAGLDREDVPLQSAVYEPSPADGARI